jgi:hypothetical protein
MPTVTRAYALARSGRFSSFEALKDRLKADGYRAVDALLAARSIRSHLQAICAAASEAPSANETPAAPKAPEVATKAPELTNP